MPPIYIPWAAETVAGILSVCADEEDVKIFELFSQGTDQERAAVLDLARRRSSGKRPPQQQLSEMDNGTTKKTKKTKKPPKMCQPCALTCPPGYVPHKALFCPRKFCELCQVYQNEKVPRAGGRRTKHGQNCPKRPRGIVNRSSTGSSASASAPLVAGAGGAPLANMPVHRDEHDVTIRATLPRVPTDELEFRATLPRVPTDEELELVPSSTPDMPHDIHFKRYGYAAGVSGVNCFFCKAVVELPISHGLEASARAEFAKIPCMRGYARANGDTEPTVDETFTNDPSRPMYGPDFVCVACHHRPGECVCQRKGLEDRQVKK